MASKKTAKSSTTVYNDIPMTLEGHPFFGIVMDEHQKALANAVWEREKKLFLVNSIAGSGKTLIATALGVLMVKYGIYNKLIYITFPGISEKTQGFLPGDLLEKSEPYFQPLYDALIAIDELPSHVCNTSPKALENGTAYIDCAVSTYMRGINIHNAFIIIDEAENADLNTLTKVISRINDDCIVLVIGHSEQCDLYDKTKSGFTACIDYLTHHHSDICVEYQLSVNHRGSISQYADLMLQKYQSPKYGFVYMVRNKRNGAVYIGSHVRTMNEADINDSWYYGDISNIKADLLEYGEDNLERYILTECDSNSELKYMEAMFSMYKEALIDEKFFEIVMRKTNTAKGYIPINRDNRKELFRDLACAYKNSR